MEQQQTMYTGMVYGSVVAVAEQLAAAGISKARRNVAQKYDFRGIDDVYNALAPLLVAQRLAIFPTVQDRQVTERKSASGTALFYVVLTVDYTIIHADDGSGITVRTVGEAMDSGDKATNKAMSAAYKYAILQTFCVPTRGDHDSESDSAVDDGVMATTGKLTSKAFADFQAAIDAAATREDCSREWQAAAAVCQAGGDLEAHGMLRDYANKRMNALRTGL